MIPRIKESKNFYNQGYYLCTVDLNQKDTYKVADHSLTLLQRTNNNHRVSHPNVGVITHCVGKTQFNVGDSILCHHFAFTDVSRKPKVHMTLDGVDYYKVSTREVFFKIAGDTLIPREGNLLCEAIYDKLIETTLELAESLVDNRRDVVKVLDVWEGCEEFKAGDYVMLQKGGDYELTFNGKSFLKVDVYFKDIMAIVGDPSWRITEIRRHVKDYNTRIQI